MTSFSAHTGASHVSRAGEGHRNRSTLMNQQSRIRINRGSAVSRFGSAKLTNHSSSFFVLFTRDALWVACLQPIVPARDDH